MDMNFETFALIFACGIITGFILGKIWFEWKTKKIEEK